MVKDDSGRFRVPQQIEEIKRKREQEKIRKEWFKKVTLWRRWMDGERHQEAQAQFAKINDPMAVSAADPRVEGRDGRTDSQDVHRVAGADRLTRRLGHADRALLG